MTRTRSLGTARATLRVTVFFTLSIITTHSTYPALAAGAQAAGVRRDARAQTTIRGTVTDPQGGAIAGASVSLVNGTGNDAKRTTGPDGAYAFDAIAPGTYQVVVTADGFAPYRSGPVYAGGATTLNAVLQIGPIEQAVVITAAAAALPASQVGAPVTVVDSRTLDVLNRPDAIEALRLVPGAHVVQSGGRGGHSSLFIRGGESTFNKVLVDGVAINDIGGAVDFAQMTTAGIDRIEVLRQTNSVMYGSDALAGVVAITTLRGRTHVPEASISLDGGNVGTLTTSAGIGGVVRRFDYYSEYSYGRTDNDVPNNTYRNGTYAGRFGVALGDNTSLSGTLRRADAKTGIPGSFDLYAIADDSSQRNELTYGSIAAQSQIGRRWQSVVRFGSADQTYRSVNPSPTGDAFDPFGFGPNYLGRVVTLRGANGYTVTGQAILDFGGAYPSPFESRAVRRTVSGETTYDVATGVSVSMGARYEREQAKSCFTAVGCLDRLPSSAIVTRDNGGAFVEARWVALSRHFVTAGVGVEHNAVFGEAVTPRLSVASFVRGASHSAIGETKLVLNAGTGIKAPNVLQQQSALFALVSTTPAGAGVEPLGPERSRSVDVGIEQAFVSGAVRARVSYFRNTFDDLIEFLSKSVLPRVGVPPAAANATAFGAYVNSESYRAHGIETSVDAAFARGWRVAASYTWLDATVTKTFGATPSFNGAFPRVAIGAYSPLPGQRPFRRPANSGTLLLMYARGRTEAALSGYFVGKRDDSTFLSDAFFGSSMLLPNRDLDAAYQKVDVSGAYRVHPRLRAYVTIDNVLNRDYDAVFGYPALPITARAGVRVIVGGDSRP